MLEEYYEQGYYLKEVNHIIEQASFFLESFVERSEKDAIILDIDETALHSPWEFLNPSVPFTHSELHGWMKQGEAEAVQSVLELYQQAIANGYVVFFITGRDIEKAEATKENLRKVGYDEWEGIFFRTEFIVGDSSDPLSSAIPYKTSIRKQLTKKGYEIVCNIGDQYSDLQGGFSNEVYRVPNPFYTVF